MNQEIIIRPAGEDDVAFILSTWLKNYRHSSDWSKGMPEQTYYKQHHALLERLLERGARADVAALAEDPTVIIGYAVTEGPTLHYVYVKKAFRRMGIGGLLLRGLPQSPTQYSHKCYDAEWMLKKWPNLTYNPYVVFR